LTCKEPWFWPEIEKEEESEEEEEEEEEDDDDKNVTDDTNEIELEVHVPLHNLLWFIALFGPQSSIDLKNDKNG
jgi:hypothetical protein